MSRFGRSRVQDRAPDSDDIPVTSDKTFGDRTFGDRTFGDKAFGRAEETRELTAGAAEMFANAGRTAPTFVDQQRLDPSRPENDRTGNDRAIDALRAATTAVGRQVAQPSNEDIAQIRALHAMTVEAERRSRRILSKPGARRRYEYVSTAQTAALQLLGFATYDEFVAVHGASGTDDSESEETILRIRALLTELGVDPLGDPLRAASDFLTAHESELTDGSLATTRPSAPIGVVYANTANVVPEPHPAGATRAGDPPSGEKLDWSKPISPASPESIERETEERERAARRRAFPEPATFEAVVDPGVRKPAAVSPMIDKPAVEQRVAGSGAEAEPDAPWVPAAQIPSTPAAATPAMPAGSSIVGATPEAPAAPQPPDDDAADRWIHAEARAERMHAEVDRAQAELVAMLARSADLEQTVVTRVDELDLVSAELGRMQQRVEALEQSIAQSGAVREELERALASSRDRISELETMLAEGEAARTLADQQRASALETVAELEATLASRVAELEQARTSVDDLEAQLIDQAGRLVGAHGEVGATHAASEALLGELESTKRSLDALDAHAEAIEAELADARRTAGSPEILRELEAVRTELSEAQHELGHLELQRAETDRLLAIDRIELQQLQHTLASTRDQTIDALDELTDVRRTVEDARTQAEAAERARDAVTIDAADLLARAEAEASNVIDRANRDAEAIRQEAMYANGVALDFNRSGDAGRADERTVHELADQVERLERKLAKQRRRLDRLSAESARGGRPKLKLKPGDFRGERRDLEDASAAEVLALAEREAAEIRRAARRERERFREELVGLLSRLAPLAANGNEEDDEDDFDDD